MEFKRWPKIENSYQQKYIDKFVEECPWLTRAFYIITEKIHGANIQMAFTPGAASYQVGSRNRWLEPGDKFFSIWEIMKQLHPTCAVIQKLANYTGESIRLFGEIFGGNIQKGVEYGDNKRILFFGMMENDVLASPMGFEQLMCYLGWHGMTGTRVVPILAHVQGLEAALAFESEGITRLGPLGVQDNIREGIVIQPEFRVAQSHKGNHFLLKCKNEKFKEKAHAPKPSIVDPLLDAWQHIFTRYVCDARVQSVFSKYGLIQEATQIGEYIRWVLQDAKEDFLMDYLEVKELDKKTQGQIFRKGGSKAAQIIKRYMVAQR